MHRDDVVRLQHMLDASNEAMEFAKGKTRNDSTLNSLLEPILDRIKSG